jgi:hypothetical protein
MTKQIIVTKRDGTKELFEAGKLRKSLAEADAPSDVVEEIVSEITAECQEETTTDIIYTRAFDKLKKKRRSFAARYSLRESLAELGPTGYPFEQFVAQIFAATDYETYVGVVMEGKCTRHEIDVVAENDDTFVLVEAKFHNSRSIKSAVQTPLYMRARFDDLSANDYGDFDTEGKKVEHWLVTNTKFSSQAVEYGECAGIHMVGWGYPAEDNLEELITRADLQPVTALTSLSGSHKRELTKQGVVLCKTLRAEGDKLEGLGFKKEKIAEVMEEVNHLCHV